jgi:hypothetical protein
VKALVFALSTWIFIVPCVIAIWLILAFLRAFMPSLYLASAGLVVALATLAIMRALLWIPQSSREHLRVPLSKYGHPSHSTGASLAH